MRLLRQFQVSLFYSRKNLKRTKMQIKQKPTNKTKISKQKIKGATMSCSHKNSKRMEIVCFAFWCFFQRSKFFRKKKNWLKIVLINTLSILLVPTFKNRLLSFIRPVQNNIFSIFDPI